MRVLVVLHRFTARTGGQLFVVDLADMLLALGHQVDIAFVQAGRLNTELTARGAICHDSLATIDMPDVAYVNSSAEAVTVACTFPNLPIIFHVHGLDDWTVEAPLLRSVRWFCCTGEVTRQALIDQSVDADRVTVLPNGFDTRRHQARRSLPVLPSQAAVFSSSASSIDVTEVARACAEAGLTLSLIGAGFGNETNDPGAALRDADIVFASGRAAIEAIGIGCAVVLWHQDGWYGMVTTRSLEELRSKNFGQNTYVKHGPAADLVREIAEYTPLDAAKVQQRLLSTQSLDAIARTIAEVLANAIAVDAMVNDATELLWLAGWSRSMSVGRLQLADELFDRRRHIQWVEERLAERDADDPWLASQPVARKEQRWASACRVGASRFPASWTPVDIGPIAEATIGWTSLGVGDGLTGWMADNPDTILEFDVVGKVVEITFWAHSWSGSAKIMYGDAEELIHLNDAAGGFIVVSLFGHMEVTPWRIAIAPNETGATEHRQVIVARVRCA